MMKEKIFGILDASDDLGIRGPIDQMMSSEKPNLM